MLVAALSASGLATADELHMAASGFTATLVGVVSVSELEASEAHQQALETQQNVPLVEQPIHLLPNGSLTSAPSQATLDVLPRIAEPNADILSADAFGPSFAGIKGFVGIREADNVRLNGFDLEPPDQGLGVYNNIAAEINNNVLQFFTATTDASLAGPIATSALFKAPSGTILSDTQAFFRSYDTALVPRRANL